MRLRLAALPCTSRLVPVPARAGPAAQVDVAKRGAAFVVDAVIVVPVPRSMAWAVMNDFDAMARYAPNLTESRIVARNGNDWTVAHNGVARLGPLRFALESVRALELTPDERVVARRLSGSMRSAQSETTFAAAGGTARIEYRARMEPAFRVPGFISRPIIERRVREQFGALAAEMPRRCAQSAAGAAQDGR